MSDRNRYRSSGPSGLTLIGPYWACGTRRYSACPPGTDPYIAENPNRAAPLFCSRTCVVSHCDCNPMVHMLQCPQEMLNGMTTLSPTAMSVTSAPTSCTMPIGSWPNTSPGFMYGPSTSYRCRSDPQIADEVILMIASVGSSIRGSGTSSTRTSRLPCQVTAFIRSPSSPPARRGPLLGRQYPFGHAANPGVPDDAGRAAHLAVQRSRAQTGPTLLQELRVIQPEGNAKHRNPDAKEAAPQQLSCPGNGIRRP